MPYPVTLEDLLSQKTSLSSSSEDTVLDVKSPYVIFVGNETSEKLESKIQSMLSDVGVDSAPTKVFSELNGFSVDITESQAEQLKGVGGVKSIEKDLPVFFESPVADTLKSRSRSRFKSKTKITTSSLSSYNDGFAGTGEYLPWGVRAVWQGQDVSTKGNFASDSYVFVIDTGVSNTTGDLNLASNSTWHRSWIPGATPFTDDDGHGTHVAGTVAALANGVGVVGVAPGAQVVSLKVFDSIGSGASYSTIIDAINYAVSVINTNGLDKNKVVINMSLGGPFSSSLDNAVRNAANQGIKFAIAAGNSGSDADGFSPASAGDHPNVFTVSAVDKNYNMTSWSNWDGNDRVDDVDVAAPGAGVLSLYRGGLAYLSGTSMAAPHVAGLLLAGGVTAGSLVNPYYTGTADPFAVASNTASTPTPTPTPTPVVDNDLVLWGTTRSDVITGAGGNDRLSGVLASGTSSFAMGRGQIDEITGLAGSDVFVLGDSRGVFYNDRNSRSSGTSDYAYIKDFKSGEDKLQLRSSNYFLASYNGSLLVYWDSNYNGTFQTSGRRQDELIAVLGGVSTLTNNDVTFV